MNDAPRAAALRAWVTGCVDRGVTPGAAWSIDGPDGAIVRGVVGSACLDPREPVSLATPWDIASLTKSLVTAPLALLAEQAGRWHLDDEVARHVHELAGTPWADVRLRALATHTAGLPAWEPFYLAGASLADYLRRLIELPAGTRGAVRYSDPGYLLLGVAIERAWGERLDRLFERHLRRPLGLSRAGFATRESAWADAAATEVGNAYERELVGRRGAHHPWRNALIRGAVHDANCWTLGGVAGHAGLFATLEDVVRLVRGLLDAAGPLDERSRRLWLEPDPSARTRTVGFVTAAGSGAARGVFPDDAPGHVGFTGCSVWIDPAIGRSYVWLTNRVHPRVAKADFQAERLAFHREARRVVS